MNRRDYVLVFEVRDANPNGNPDADNMPRIDPVTGQGLVSDVCIKRKIRDYVAATREGQEGFDIFFGNDVVLNTQLEDIAKEAGVNPKEGKKKRSKKEKQDLAKLVCEKYWDVRTFGAVLSTGPNFGQVRGPVQVGWGRSVAPVVASHHTITRQSRTDEKENSENKTMGGKYTVSHGVYIVNISVNPFFAEKTGFSDEDMQVLTEALKNLFRFDASSARPAGSMLVRQLFAFEHDSEYGSCPERIIFDAVKVTPTVEVPTCWEDYEVKVESGFSGVTVYDLAWDQHYTGE